MSNRPRIVMTSGVFDILHRGHLNLLWASKQLGDLLVVGVVESAGVFAYKRVWPRETAEVRIRNLARLGFVDSVALQQTTDPTPLLERFRPDVFTHGDDWERLLQGQESLEQLGVEFVKLPYTPGISSTALRDSAAA